MPDHDHVAKLFDTNESRNDAVFTFTRDGLLAGDAVLLVVTPPVWKSLSRRCVDEGVDAVGAMAVGRLTVRDAEESLARLLACDVPEWPLFDASVGALVRSLRSKNPRVRIYGEMVDVLARAGEFEAAERLETFWNRLIDEETVTLLCGYAAEHFGNPRDRAAFGRICQRHSRVETQPRDVLGNFLLKTLGAC